MASSSDVHVSGNGKGRARRVKTKPRPEPEPIVKAEPKPVPQPPETVDAMGSILDAVKHTRQSMEMSAQSFVSMTNAFSMTRDEFLKIYQGGPSQSEQIVQPTPRRVPAAANVKTFYVCNSPSCRVDEFWSWPGTTVAMCPSCSIVSNNVSSTTKP